MSVSATTAPTSATAATVATKAGASGGGGGGGQGGDDWTAALVSGVLIGFFLLGACWFCCRAVRKRSDKESDDTASAAAAPPAGCATVDEEAGASPALESSLPAPAAAEVSETSGQPPGHDGALPATATVRIHDAKLENSDSVSAEAALPLAFPPLTAPFRLGVVAGPAAPGAGDGGVAVGIGAGAGGATAATLTKEAGGRTMFASPANYGEFPQPFSSPSVPVVPYERRDSGSRAGGGGLDAQQQSEGRACFPWTRGRSLEGGGEDVWSAQPEIDMADLVMDNNKFYTPHGDSGGDKSLSDNKALRESVVMVAVAAAETQALRRSSSYGSSGFSRSSAVAGWDNILDTGSQNSLHSFDSSDDVRSSASADRKLAAAAVAAARSASAAFSSPGSDQNSWTISLPTDDGFNPVPPTPSSLPGLLSRSFSSSMVGFGQQQQPQQQRQQQLSPNAAFLQAEAREAEVAAIGGGRDADKSGPSLAAADGSADADRVALPRPPAAPSSGVGGQQIEHHILLRRQKQLLPQQKREQFRRSYSRYSSGGEDGGGVMLSSLPESGVCRDLTESRVRYPPPVNIGGGVEAGAVIRGPPSSLFDTGSGSDSCSRSGETQGVEPSGISVDDATRVNPGASETSTRYAATPAAAAMDSPGGKVATTAATATTSTTTKCNSLKQVKQEVDHGGGEQGSNAGQGMDRESSESSFLSYSARSTARFFGSGGGGGGGGGASGVSVLLTSCVELTPPPTPGAAASYRRGAAEAVGRGGGEEGGQESGQRVAMRASLANTE